MFYGGSLLNVPIFLRTWHLDFFAVTISFLRSHTALLRLLVWRACMCCCLHFRSMCSHVAGFGELHIGHVIDGRLPYQRTVVSWHSPCIDRVSVLEDIFFESLGTQC